MDQDFTSLLTYLAGSTECNSLASNSFEEIFDDPPTKKLKLSHPDISVSSRMYAQTWEKLFAEMKAYKEEHGHCLVRTDKSKLGRWVDRQRQEHRKGRLQPSRVEDLESIGFIWKVACQQADLIWNQMLLELKAYREEHGNCLVKTEKSKLGRWVHRQRCQYRNGRLTTKQIYNLESTGFIWKVERRQSEISWKRMYSSLKKYQQQHGNCLVTNSKSKLGRWVQRQRRQHRYDLLTTKQTNELESIGFTWKCHLESWDEMYSKLLEYSSIHGNCNVPLKDGKLGRWVYNQRCRRDGKSDLKSDLTVDQNLRLDKVGLYAKIKASPESTQSAEISAEESTEESERNDSVLWEQMFCELKAYEKERGNRSASFIKAKLHDIDTGLERWVVSQRKQYDNGTLAKEQIEELDSIGFCWELDIERTKTPWAESFLKLKKYVEIHGQCHVPYKDGKLGRWVHNQRQKYTNGRLTKGQIKDLELIGFIWKRRQNPRQSWDQMYLKLKGFAEKHGNCCVPASDAKLARWVKKSTIS